MEDDLKRKMTSKYESRISQQPLVGSYSNLKLKLMGSNQSVQRYEMKTTSNGRRPPTEEDLKIWKVEYLSNHWLDLTQIWNLSLWDQTRVYKGMKWRRPPMEDDLKIWKVEYLSNHWSDLTQIWNWSYCDQPRVYKCMSWRRLPMEDDLQGKMTSKYGKLNISATTSWVLLKFET